MKKIFITGGAGYIGSHTILALAETGEYKIKVFDNFRNGNRKALEIIEKETGVELQVVEGDLLDYDALEKTLGEEPMDAVMHFAALIEAGESMKYPVRFYENNVSGTINLLKAMQTHNLRKLVFSSTAAVYGTPDSGMVSEDSPSRLESVYGATKYTMEEILRSLATEHVADEERISSVILRYFNAAGADPQLRIGQDYPNPTHLITRAIESALGLRDGFKIFGNDYDTPDGTCIRDYIHVSDLASGHVKALEYLFSHDGSDVFNLGTGKGTSNLEILQALEELHGEFDWEWGPRRPGDPARCYANPKKAEDLLGWKAKYSVQDAVRDAYEWKKTYPHGFQDIISLRYDISML